MERADERCETHCCSENEVAPLPGCEQIWFVVAEGLEERGYDFGPARGEAARAVLVGGLDDEGEEDGASEGDYREYDKGEGAYAADVAEGVFAGGGGGGGVVAEVDFADPGCAVEEEGEPA